MTGMLQSLRKAAVNAYEIISGFEGAVWGLWVNAAKISARSFSREENKENAHKILLLNKVEDHCQC